MTTADAVRVADIYKRLAEDSDAVARDGGEWQAAYYAGRADALRSAADILLAMAGIQLRTPARPEAAVA